MADQHNQNIPALTNQIAADIPDIKENLEFHKDALQRIFHAWSDTDNSAAKIAMATGFYNGTYTVDFPTNGLANAKLMLGDSNTIAWFYLNAAPPGWKVLTTGADMVLAVAGGSAAYNVNGGNPDAAATWAISGLTANEHIHTVDSHTHTGPNHTHKWYEWNEGASDDQSYSSSGSVASITYGSNLGYGLQVVSPSPKLSSDYWTSSAGTGSTGGTGPYTAAASANGVSATGAWRPKASVGKLFQLDTA